jgi:hypothetical protein
MGSHENQLRPRTAVVEFLKKYCAKGARDFDAQMWGITFWKGDLTKY